MERPYASTSAAATSSVHPAARQRDQRLPIPAVKVSPEPITASNTSVSSIALQTTALDRAAKPIQHKNYLPNTKGGLFRRRREVALY
jgi:hypothetical protein